jgi:hypothetical protein
MKSKLRYVGLDVHVDSITVAVAEEGGEARSLGTIPNTAEALRKLIVRLGPSERLRICYEAGLCGFVLYWCRASRETSVATRPNGGAAQRFISRICDCSDD